MTLRFGTDGVRGLVGAELTPELTLALGRVAARVLSPGRPGSGASGTGGSGPETGASGTDAPGTGGPGNRGTEFDQCSQIGGPETRGSGVAPIRPTFVIGRDTRRSGPLLQSALTAGLAAEGVDVVDVGVLPTPGVAALSVRLGCPAAVISASHNPFADNGIKLFGPGGRKLDEAVESEIERRLAAAAGPGTDDADGRGPPERPVTGAAIGTVRHDPDALGWYRRHLVDALGGRRLEGFRVVVDCGNGAASVTALDCLAEAGAEVVDALAVTPDGCNINDRSGSTDTRSLARAVVARRADAGLAFDGDADRIIAVDGDGRVVDGDRLLALFALDLHHRGELAGDTLVVTVMSNLGLHRAMADAGIAVHATPVGDRHVLAALDAHGWSLGGEQSGHLIFPALATTGDGVLSGLMLIDLLVRSGRSLAPAASAVMRRFPQVLHNVAVADRDGLGGAGAVWAEVARVEADLGGTGRVLLRSSGTEPLVRVMVEAETEEAAAAAAEVLRRAVERELGPPGG